jgi:anti-sigma factor ChrR (cupin superfamily)
LGEVAERPWCHLTTVSSQQLSNGLATIPAGPEGWERTAIAGIDVKPLFVDAHKRRVSMLVKMSAGTSYPSHRHAASEECFVVSGEIQVGERTLRTGDYQVASEGSVHGVQRTEVGCVLFIVSSQDDELL